MPERYAIIGTGHRAEMYIDAIATEHADRAELVAWIEPNPARRSYFESRLARLGVAAPVAYAPDDLEVMIERERISRVIVTTPDFTHAELVSRALRAGADVVVEKPLTIDEAGVRVIRAAIADSGRDVITTFNYRYSPRNSALKRVILDGTIGEVTSVHFEWILDTMHGADYFRRWHRDKAKSGGLLVHKASHHFDLVNWWIADAPQRVFASGGLRFYGAESAVRRGVGPRPERGSEAAARDPFSLDLREDPRLAAMYLEGEKFDGYRRDRDVFDDDITIEDNLAAIVDYRGGPTLSYSLNAHGPWEGYRVQVNGTAGRAELDVVERPAVLTDADGRLVVDPSATEVADRDPGARAKGDRLVVQRHWQHAVEQPIEMGAGSHGGGDAILLSHLFSRTTEDAPLERIAGFDAGVRAISVGIAGNRSLATGQPVTIDELDFGH